MNNPKDEDRMLRFLVWLLVCFIFLAILILATNAHL